MQYASDSGVTFQFNQASNGAWTRKDLSAPLPTTSWQNCGRSVKVVDSLTLAVGCDRYRNYGAVQIFTRPTAVSTVWTQKQLILRPKLTPIFDYFGSNLAVNSNGKRLGIGAWGADDGVGERCMVLGEQCMVLGGQSIGLLKCTVLTVCTH